MVNNLSAARLREMGLLWFLFFLPINEVVMLVGLLTAWGAYGYQLFKNQAGWPALDRSSYIFLALGFSSIVVAFFSPIRQTSLVFSLTLFLSAALGFIFFQSLDFSAEKLPIYALAFLVGVTCLTAFHLGKHIYDYGFHFSKNRLGYHAYLSLFISVSLPLIFARILDNGRRWFDLPWFIFLLVCFVLTFGRGAWLAGIISMGYVAVKHSRKTALIYLASLIIVIIIIFPFIRRKAVDLFRPNTRSNAQRIIGWRTALKMVGKYPLTGVGFANFKGRYWSDEFRPPTAKARLAHAHNIFLQIYAEQGIVVGSFFLILVLYLVGRGVLTVTGPVLSGFSGALLSLIIGGQFACSMLINLRIWLLFCFLGALISISGVSEV